MIDYDMYDDDPIHELTLRIIELLEESRSVPADVVRGPGRTRAEYLALNDRVGHIPTGSTPGELIEGPDGEPVGVGPSKESTGYFGGLICTTKDLARVGLTASDVPNIRVIDTDETGRNNE